jgi:FtsH-binding integral membrane protein
MKPNWSTQTDMAQGRSTTYDAGLQRYFNKVYNMMAFGLVVTGLIAYVTANTPALFQAINGSILGIVVALAPLGILFFGLSPAKVARMSVGAVTGIYLLLTALIGLSMSYIFVAYTGASIAKVFFITAGTFAAMSIYGYTTKRDLSKMGSFLVMAVIGLIIASVVNMFLQSPMMQYVISGIGVIAFTGLTAVDTQRIKETYNSAMDRDSMMKLVIMGALNLYLDFINLFQFLLMFLGNRE